MQNMGIITDISDRCLNHAEGSKMKRTYHLHDYEREMKKAWYLLGEALSVITGPKGDEFLQAYLDDKSKDLEEQTSFPVLVKQFYVKPEYPPKQALQSLKSLV